MSYTRNFGIRSFENIVRNGRFRVPATGTPFFIGAPVTMDPANPGLLKAADAAAPGGPTAGLVIYEHITHRGVDPALSSTNDAPYNQVPLGQYAQLVHGVGFKIWLKNTDDKLLYDGRSVPAGGLLADSVVTALDGGTLQVGTGLVPDGAGKYRAVDGAAVTPEQAWMVIEQANPSTGTVEARFIF